MLNKGIMKKTIIYTVFILALVLFSSCMESKTEGLSGIGNVQVIEVSGCEYVIYQGSSQGGIIHKQNCKYHSNNVK